MIKPIPSFTILGGICLKRIIKLLIKSISWLLIAFIILTLVIAITKLSKPRQIDIDISSLSDIQREIFLRRYGGSTTITTSTSFETLKDDVISYYKLLLKGDLGWTYKIVRKVDSMGNRVSYRENLEPINEILKTGFFRSMKLLVSSLGLALVLGILKGVFDSKKHKKNNSTFKLFTTVIGLSIPVIFLAPLFQFLGIWLRNKYGFNIDVVGYEKLKHMVLPMIVLSILPTMYIARLIAVAMDKAYENEYVRTAISKGSSRLRVMWVHVFRNAIVEVAGSLPAVLTIIISDLAIVEYLFEYKGLTYMMIDFYDKGQPDAVTGLALVLCAIYLSFYSLFKLLKFVLDPKRGRAVI
ncbi:MAG: ABC transporter permease [Gottschalkiaceae bacterium]|nr:MAG: ABC transporter permease [Gottschalkiaceae bacterium]